ncbi:hypothetical protein KIL84_023445, partial [Mauremys mutica]
GLKSNLGQRKKHPPNYKIEISGLFSTFVTYQQAVFPPDGDWIVGLKWFSGIRSLLLLCYQSKFAIAPHCVDMLLFHYYVPLMYCVAWWENDLLTLTLKI